MAEAEAEVAMEVAMAAAMVAAVVAVVAEASSLLQRVAEHGSRSAQRR